MTPARSLGLCLTPILALGLACAPAHDPRQLPTGATLDPAGVSIPLGSFPVAMMFSPDSGRIVAVLSGYREQGIQVIDPHSLRVEQTVLQQAAFLGAAFSPDGRSLFVSGGDRDLIYRYSWDQNRASLKDSIALGPPPGPDGGRRYPAGLACSSDGARLYVAENLGDSLAVIDLAARQVIQRCATAAYPSGVVADSAKVYVSAWNRSSLTTFLDQSGHLAPGPSIEVGRHPSTLHLDRPRHRLYVTSASSNRIAVIDTRQDRTLIALNDPAPGAPAEGSTPDGLTLSPDGRRLYVAEADNNAVAVFSLSASTSGVPEATGADSLVGRIPVEWYPTAVLARGGSLWALNGKGHGTAPNPGRGPSDRTTREPRQYTLGQLDGSLSTLAAVNDAALAAFSKRVAHANGWDRPRDAGRLPPFRHVIYLVRENRTYDQVLGDLHAADGDDSITYFPRDVTPNAHALAERFGIWDRFFVNAEVSGDGHNWTSAAYASDYVEKSLPSEYSGRGRAYDYEGENRDTLTDDDAAEPTNGYLWDLARQAGKTFRNYGDFTYHAHDGRWVGTKPWLAAHTDTRFPGWDLSVPDTIREARWEEEFRGQVAGDSMPALTILRLPNDHTAGGKAGALSPRAFAADNDLALGRLVERLTHSPFWKSTVLFVLEDDAQDGPDHVDSHRSPLLVISPYSHGGVMHRFANTTDVLATIDLALGFGALSHFDYFGRPLTWGFTSAADTTSYTALRPKVSMDERNPDHTRIAFLSRRLDFSREDRADEGLFNRVLWEMMKGPNVPYPRRRRVSSAGD
jgi:YVTN family beta-propeller protein